MRELYVCGGGKGDVGRGRSQKGKVAIICTQIFCRLNFRSFTVLEPSTNNLICK